MTEKMHHNYSHTSNKHAIEISHLIFESIPHSIFTTYNHPIYLFGNTHQLFPQKLMTMLYSLTNPEEQLPWE